MLEYVHVESQRRPGWGNKLNHVRAPQRERARDANSSKLKYILIWKEHVEQEVRWSSEIGWKCYETEVFLLGITSPPKKLVGVKKSNGNAVKYNFIYFE